MKKILFILIFIITLYSRISAASMADYCAVPPFITQSVYPNILIILDNSGSMYNFAYENDFNPSITYYGYFDSDKKYKYDNGGEYFYEDASGEWDGNFLNWLTMRRVDLLKKVLVGGREDQSSDGSWYLMGEPNPDRDYNKEYSNVDDYTPYSGNQSFLVTGGKFYVGYWSGDVFYYYDNPYYIKIKLEDEKTGIIQKMWDKVRFGLMFFNVGNKFEDGRNSDGGYVAEWISGPGENQELVNEIRNIEPSTWTPLAETYYEALRYFGAEDSAYNRGVNYSHNDPVQYRCQKNFVLLITDGESTKDENLPGGYFNGNVGKVTDSNLDIKTWMDKIAENEGYSSQWSSELSEDGTYYLEGVAYYSHVSDLRSDMDGSQNLNLYVVYTFGNSDTARDLLKKAAKYGGFKDINDNNVPDLQKEWDNDDNGVPDNYFEAQSGYKIKDDIYRAISNILKKTSSGTSVSVLAKKVKMGSLLNQAVFYAKKDVNNTEINWIGQLFTYWFYNDKGVQNIREDTIVNHALDICSYGSYGGDEILEFDVDNTTGDLEIKKYKSACTGEKYDNDNQIPETVNSLDDVKYLWEAGKELADTSYDNRTIYTTDGHSLISFDTDHISSFQAYLGSDNYTDSSTPFPDNMTVDNITNYIRGLDFSGARNRSYNDNGTTKVWKLGDIIYSSPKVVDYNDYAMVYVGANDGMLHAFRLGYLSKSGLSQYQVAKLCNSSSSCSVDKLGKEEWAFIPKDVLPYLRYLADPDYCHIYTVDLTPYMIYDVESSNSTVRKILIGGMRMGGGVTGCSTSDGCINPPEDTCSPAAYSYDNDSCVGRSSYFALDVTDPRNPNFLWEFNKPYLGFAYSGPGIIKRKNDNGTVNYYIVFTSGPTNYRGESKQDLHLYILKLDSDFKISQIYDETNKLGNQNNAFGSRIMSDGIDRDNDGNTDLLFFGMTQLNGSAWQGNVFAIRPTDDENPDNWDYIKVFNQGTSAITSSIRYMKCFNHDYIYFGTGRWYYRGDDPGQNSNDKESLYGVMIDGCFSGNCNVNQAKNTTESCSELDSAQSVWAYKVDLDPKTGNYTKERLISDPAVDPYDNLVFFATTEPSSDVCLFGGRSRMWGLNCATGLSMFDTSCADKGYVSEVLQNTVYMQLSRGNIVQVNKNAFTENNRATTEWHQGITPETQPILPPPYKGYSPYILLWLEK
ncbi:hypothetical protein [Hippea maritima]|uniref:Type IV pilin biogenesis protein n=1 Tax=Hippea maritima (strain ATCC 700847 / DSM 10411 / MH2) TaxID=760142 RepID=F2LWC1_HIPMA|nr:hypothetical protein [Hippea maritima]AEA34055.1 hypothetical protein Hipma_1089 [Hippea maritima DSM 10411]